MYGLAKHVTSLQLSRFIECKDIQVVGCDLLTKYEGARSLAFKTTIRTCDYGRVKNSDKWPVGVGIRQFKSPPPPPLTGRDGKNINDSQREKQKSILKKQVNNTAQNETSHGNQTNMQRQNIYVYINVSRMQNSMLEHHAVVNTWRPQPENLPRQVRFDGIQADDYA